MPRAKAKTKTEPTAVDVDEKWTVVQVASFLGISYQRARDNMLAADYGPSDYIAKTRTLLVSASAVRDWKEKHGRKRKRKQTRRARS